MSAIATVLLAMGHRVSGSDAADSDRLAPAGRRWGRRATSVMIPRWVGDADVVGISTAIPADDVEVAEAERGACGCGGGPSCWPPSAAQRRTVAVAGTHGKTSTSAMLAVILRQAGLHPSYIVGGDVIRLGPGRRGIPMANGWSSRPTRATAPFSSWAPKRSWSPASSPTIWTSTATTAPCARRFVAFAEAAPGPRVVCADDPGAALPWRAVWPGMAGGAGESRRRGRDGRRPTAPAATSHPHRGRRARAPGRPVLAPARAGGGPVDGWTGVPGLHNVRNAVAALTMAQALGCRGKWPAHGLARYRGRRPALRAAGRARTASPSSTTTATFPGRWPPPGWPPPTGRWDRVVAVFQPHRYSRTAALWPDFADAFEGADVLLVTDIYPAGEARRPGVTGRLIADAVAAPTPTPTSATCPTLDDAEAELRRILRAGRPVSHARRRRPDHPARSVPRTRRAGSPDGQSGAPNGQ